MEDQLAIHIMPTPNQTSYERERQSIVLIFYLQRNQERNCLHRIVASVNIVSHEEIVSVWRLPSNLKQLHQVMELTMDISTDCHWTSHLLHVGFLCKDLLGLK